MAHIIVLGGGVCGLATGLLLRRDGHDVTVLERDADPLPASPEEAWERWERDGVAQFRQTHYLTPRGWEVLEQTLPDVAAALEPAGGLRLDMLQLMPPTIADRSPRPGDERFVTVNARRPTLEHVLGGIAQDEPGLELRRGTAVRELVVRAYDGVTHVAGVRTDAGEELGGELIVDAMGRRSPLPRLLEAAGAGAVREQAEDSGFLYYSRYFRGTMPQFRAGTLTPVGTFSILTIPADDSTWSVTLYAASGDRPLKQLRDPERWTALMRACPQHAHWLDGEPITGVMPMAGIIDRHRRLDGVTGLAPAGDAWACTNPSQGRGMTMALLHASLLRDTVCAHLGDDPREFAAVWDAVTEAELAPWYRETLEEDRDRLREMQALRAGRHYVRPPGSQGALLGALRRGAMRDPDAFRAFVGNRCCLRLQRDIYADERVSRILDQPAGDGAPLPGPDRQQLLKLLADSPGGVAQAGEAAAQRP